MKRLVVVIGLFTLAACGNNGSTNGVTPTDPYDGLRDAGLGEIECNQDSCCLTGCWGRLDRVCVTRLPPIIIESIEGKPDDGCSTLIFPEWFYSYDCFVVTEAVRGDTGEPYSPGFNRYEVADQIIVMTMRCFCGRTGTDYASSVKQSLYMKYFPESCRVEFNNPPDYELSSGIVDSLESCNNPCRTCTPRCSGRRCGPDGCGGSCGSCTEGQTCNAAGECVTSGSGDTCSDCLSVCIGMPGCCTGCGCMCEDECGGCW
ncbi:MAG: hypothetical protein JRG91_19505, partial [Deltaproteobacteria bacterium]|nr:hypothetical protein [Deltaproteobacteria bacterium]